MYRQLTDLPTARRIGSHELFGWRYNRSMESCPRCGALLEPGKACTRCEQETIHVTGEVIPPGTSGEQRAPRLSGFALALALAIAADVVQIVLFPLFMRGFLSPLDDLLDIAVGFTMVRLLGWHWAFLPSFLGKVVPILDELPCWTLAVLFVRSRSN